MDTAVIDPSEVLHARAGQRVEDEPRDESRPEPSPELRAIEEEMSRRHWEAWLDTRVPALGNKTPRQAARTARGRERLEALLAEFDRHTTDGPSRVGAPTAAIRAALGLAEPLT